MDKPKNTYNRRNKPILIHSQDNKRNNNKKKMNKKEPQEENAEELINKLKTKGFKEVKEKCEVCGKKAIQLWKRYNVWRCRPCLEKTKKTYTKGIIKETFGE